MWLCAGFSVLAFLLLQEVWVIFLLFPTMGKWTLVHIWAALLVRCYEVPCLPVRAHLITVLKDWGFTSVVLPIVGIYTDFSVVIIFPVRAPHSLEMKHVKVHVNVILLNHLNREFCFTMGKRAILLILTLGCLPRFKVRRAEFGFVFVRMIEFFHSIVGFVTLVSMRALISLFGFSRLILDMWTHLRLICS